MRSLTAVTNRSATNVQRQYSVTGYDVNKLLNPDKEMEEAHKEFTINRWKRYFAKYKPENAPDYKKTGIVATVAEAVDTKDHPFITEPVLAKFHRDWEIQQNDPWNEFSLQYCLERDPKKFAELEKVYLELVPEKLRLPTMISDPMKESDIVAELSEQKKEEMRVAVNSTAATEPETNDEYYDALKMYQESIGYVNAKGAKPHVSRIEPATSLYPRIFKQIDEVGAAVEELLPMATDVPQRTQDFEKMLASEFYSNYTDGKISAKEMVSKFFQQERPELLKKQ